MKIGLILAAHHQEGEAVPGWSDILAQAKAAEAVGFDTLTIPDALTDGPLNYWEGMTLAGALAAGTTKIGLVHSTINAPMRPPAVVARAAHTLDEVSGGRYTLGVGAGNTPDDYRMFGVDADPRYSRFAEALTVIAALLRTRSVDFDGTFQTAHAQSFSPTGPRPESIPINVAAGGPKMLALAVRLADQWNWWAGAAGGADHLPAILETISRECEAQGREPSTLHRTLDLYSFDALGVVDEPRPSIHAGSADEMAASLLAYGALGVDEVRIDIAVAPLERRVDAIEAMAPVVEALHAA